MLFIVSNKMSQGLVQSHMGLSTGCADKISCIYHIDVIMVPVTSKTYAPILDLFLEAPVLS